MMSRTHTILDTAGEGKTRLYANRTPSQVPIQPSLFGNSNNLPKKPKVNKEVKKEVSKEIIKERGILIDPWSGLCGPPGTIIQPLPARPFKSASVLTSPKGLGANPITTSSNQKIQPIISSKEHDANLSNERNQRRRQRHLSTSPKRPGANDLSDNSRDKDIIPRDAIEHVSPLTSEDEDEIKPSHQDYSNIGHVDKDLPLPTSRKRKKESFPQGIAESHHQ